MAIVPLIEEDSTFMNLSRKTLSNQEHGWLVQATKASGYKLICFDKESLISGVATQGKNRDASSDIANSQWVERYKLQYSNDGLDFEYYHEQGKSTPKVRRKTNN